MNLEERLSLLERNHDWSGLQETLEQGIAGSDNPAAQAEYHLRLGRLLRERFMQGVKALKHFQDAFKLNAALLEALAEARQVYWELGKLNMVVACLLEDLLARAGRTDAILEQQRAILGSIADPLERSRVAFTFGTRWAMRHQNHELGAEFVEQAVEADPSNEAAFAYLRE